MHAVGRALRHRTGRAAAFASGAAQGRRRDGGTVLVLAIGGVLLVITVVIALSDAALLHVRRAALASVADDAAIAASQGIDIAALYRDGIGATLPLDPALASEYAHRSVAATDDPRLVDLRVDAVEVAGDTVRVVVSAGLPPQLAVLFPGSRLRAMAEAASHTRL